MVLKGCKDNFPVPLKCFANDLNNSKEERIALNELNNYAIFLGTREISKASLSKAI